ncbi:hypothetical protein LZK98_08715 [Sphingomonas cannabina]|uniref:hypothetical protein n=1 Tax=Sphingomonas cannabina TaxID=2899123 RepID=UPI001F194414|nr:hypothetical protein [Sphingomonas cannabina]UIJ47008.1 hypothetical protein LZK98_08715 [Sphingomonas cannabina]
MTKFFKIALATTLALGATSAFAGEPANSFRLEGRTYTYNTETDAAGNTVLVGHAQPGGEFRLVVKGGRVSGDVAGQPVAFSVAESRGAARRAQFAAAGSTGFETAARD